MTRIKSAVSGLALLALAAGGIGAVSLYPADLHAQPANQAAPAAQTPMQHHRHFDPARHVEGRIAYMKAELKITPEQQPLFDKVADAMRENAKDRAAAFSEFRQRGDTPMNAVEKLETREHLSEMHVAHMQRTLAAVKPLYDSLTPDQKKVADELLSFHGHMHHHHA